jgi:hypothetical protein
MAKMGVSTEAVPVPDIAEGGFGPMGQPGPSASPAWARHGPRRPDAAPAADRAACAGYGAAGLRVRADPATVEPAHVGMMSGRPMSPPMGV